MFCSCYSHQTEEETLQEFREEFAAEHQCCSKSRSPFGDHVFAFDVFRKANVWLLLDQIKPIEQLVPVS